MLFIQFWFSKVSGKNYLCSFQWALPRKKRKKGNDIWKSTFQESFLPIIALEYYSGFSEG